MMLRYLAKFKEKVDDLRLSPIELFETAYVSVFGKIGNITPDYCIYIQEAILPKYVCKWLDSI